MIDFKCVFESILTYKYTNEDLDNFLKEEFFPIIFSYPCHSQAIERRIKDITSSTLKLKKPEERDGMLMNVINCKKNNSYIQYNKMLHCFMHILF